MVKVINFLKKWGSGKIVLCLFIATMVVYLAMLFYSLPAVERFAHGKRLFDLSPAGYSYSDAISLLETLGTEGRNVYVTLQLPIDFIYPGLLLSRTPSSLHGFSAKAVLLILQCIILLSYRSLQVCATILKTLASLE